MRETARWIHWRQIPDRHEAHKLRKIPSDPFTGQVFEKGSGWQTDPTRWASFTQGNGEPKGFVLGDGWAGLDLDDCVVKGTVAPWALDVVRRLGTYAEISPSGTGIKLFMRATRSEGAEQVKRCDAWAFEIYTSGRYFTVTGNKLPDAPPDIGDGTEALKRLTDIVWGDDLHALCTLRGLVRSTSGESIHIHCPWEAEHTHGNGPKDAALQVKDGRVVGFHCFHSHCSQRTLRDIRMFFGVTAGVAHPLTEAGDGECFADLYRDRVRYDFRRGRWVVSDAATGIWLPDAIERLTQMTIEMMRVRQQQALALKDLDQKKKAVKWTVEGEGRRRLQNAQALARSVQPIADSGEHWDEDPFLLGVQNGVIEQKTGRFRKATPDDRVTMRVRVAYDPAATCPLWLKTLNAIFAPNDLLTAAESTLMVAFMQRALGYSITGDCREECCFFGHGPGGNGKGTVMNTVGWLFGDYTDDLPYSTLERSANGSAIPNDLAKLVGKRFVTCAEVNEFTLNEKRLKALTGRDPITARFLHQEFFTYIPVCKIWIATNNKPQIVGLDDGIWRRIHLIPFTQKFEGLANNKQLKDQLRGELPGILNWVIEGTQKWLRDGLHPPDAVRAATAAYRQESNPLTPFIDACCVIEGHRQVPAGRAFQAYETFCRETHVEAWKTLSNKGFYAAMAQRFQKVEVRAGSRQQTYIGVDLRRAEPQGYTDFTDQDEGAPG